MNLTLRMVQFEDPKDFYSKIVFQEFITIKHGQKISVGRSSSCEIILDDGYTSSLHAILQFKNNSLLISDSVSKNGTKVNGVKIRSQIPIFIKDVISIGRTYIHIDEDKLSSEVKAIFQRSVDDTFTNYLPTDDFTEITNIKLPELEFPKLKKRKTN